MGTIETIAYKVKKGDCLWNIVKDAGFPPNDWEKIYDAPYNRALKAKIKKENRTPDLILPGEIVFLPAFNKSDMKKQIDVVKTIKKQMDKIGVPLPKLEKQIKDLKRQKNAERSEKENIFPGKEETRIDRGKWAGRKKKEIRRSHKKAHLVYRVCRKQWHFILLFWIMSLTVNLI